MPRPTRPLLFRLLLALGLTVLVQGCQLSLPGGGGKSSDVTPNAVAGDAIEVTALDAGPAPGAPAPSAASAAAPGTPQGANAPPAQPPATPAPAAVAVPSPEDLPLPEPAVEAPGMAKSEAQLTCEKRKGRWVPLGQAGELRTCIFNTKDSGKQCSRESQCEGACLARSGTCAPFRPLIGCHEVLQDNGMRATQCLQ